MGVNQVISVDDAEVAGLLGKLLQRLGDLTPVMEVIGEIVHASILRNFEVGGRPAWQGLSDVTISRRIAEKKWPGQILVRSGELMRSISYQAFPDKVVLSANSIKAATLHFGARKGQFGQKVVRVKSFTRRDGVKVSSHNRKTTLPWGDIPARPFMMVQPEDWGEIRESLVDILEQA
ncbi:phage virion morphogenesis protein [Desulfatibacillum aliphaticivorans]|uniref:phage virion morphogenesis protein n=1 Tax=Desulfatibacillum aliphaticivorans TaxID=218208 RepID=UPI000401C76C|nr:phage virion morphogenesis protein [Desulfatibacillum aliphaticivorans]